MEQLARLDRAHIISADGNQSNGSTPAIDKFNLVALCVLVDVNNRANITASEFLVWRFRIKYNQGVFSDHCLSSG
jgi:hypothetical protein